MNSEELMRAIIKLHFGFHIFTYGDGLFKLTLIDWEVKPPDDNVVWQNDDQPDTLLALLTHAYMFAQSHREAIPV